MAGFFQNLLKDTAKGFFGSEYLRDYTHASKTFRTNAYAMAPKYKFLFHVYFDINWDLINSSLVGFPQNPNFGLAVKSAQLPKYSFDLHELNQYNRKRIVQTKIKYDPVSIIFHDDNSNLIRQLWYAYYSYYYKDSTQVDAFESTTPTAKQSPNATGVKLQDLNSRSIYDPSIAGANDWGYIGEGQNSQGTALSATVGTTKAPFFRSVQIFGFNQHNFVMYKLMNPIIESFNHDTYDYAQSNGTMENTMTIRYENVKYYDGALDGKDPSKFVKQFGSDTNYDRTVSPIARPGSQSTILGQGGLLDAAGGVMSDIANGNYLGAVQKAGAAANTFKNPQNILKAATSEVIGAVTNEVTQTPNRNTGFNFPIASSLNPTDIVKNVNSSLNKILNRPPTV